MPNPLEPAVRCPLCRKPARSEHSPFCSRRCKDRDLLKWLGEHYRIAGPPADELAEGDRLDSDRSEG